MSRLIEYLAGFFDGEGSIGLYKNKRCIQIRVGQVREEPLKLYVSVFGGKVYFSQITKGGLPYYQYNTTDSLRCGKILSSLYPYLIVKQEKAQAALELLGRPVPTSLQNVSLEYLAGFFDAEGSISIANMSSVNVCVTQVDKTVLLLFQQCFGGNIYHKGSGVYGWSLRSKELQEFCNSLIPYAVVQKDRLILLKRFQLIDLRVVRYKTEELKEALTQEKFKLAVQIAALNLMKDKRIEVSDMFAD